jgi:hypothetical protein
MIDLTKKAVIAAMALAMPGFASAQESTGPELFSLPAGCTAFLTVQSNDCSVDHHFKCAGDPEGVQRRVSLDERGMTYLGSIDSETQWVNSYHPLSNHSERLASDPVDPASFSELLATNRDSYDFQTLSDEIGTTRYVGEDRLTGMTVVIDGVTLDQTSYQITAYAPDGSLQWASKGNEYISRDYRTFLSGVGTVTTPTDEYQRDASPVEFALPGETGFLSAKPKFGCGAVMSSFEVTQ